MTFTDGFYENYEGIINILIEKGVFTDRTMALESIVYSFFRVWDELEMDADRIKQLDPTGEMPMPIDNTKWVHGIIYSFRFTSQLESWWDDIHTTQKYNEQISSKVIVEGEASSISADLDEQLQNLVDIGVFNSVHTAVESILMCAMILLNLTGLSKEILSTEYENKFPIKNLDDVEYYISGLINSTLFETKYDTTMQKIGYPKKYDVVDGTIAALPSTATLLIKKKL
jgi:hypothetical protein